MTQPLPVPVCAACNLRPATHVHIQNTTEVLRRAINSGLGSDEVVDGETRSVRVRIPPERVAHLCGACLAPYAAAHEGSVHRIREDV